MTRYRRRLIKANPTLLTGRVVAALASALVALFVVTLYPLSASSGAIASAHSKSTTTEISGTGATAGASPPSIPRATGGLIVSGPSRSECLTLNTSSGQSGLSYIQSSVASFDSSTGSSVTCISSYLNGSATWSAWEHPWITSSQYGYTTWVAAQPQNRQLVLEMNLIPNDLENINNPVTWERSCIAGDFSSYATELGTSLVSAGLQNSVIRLGAEMNGVWEDDFIGTKASEQKLWAKCFDKEVTGLRKASGEHFLIDWNPNACVGNYPYGNFYPGNAYVDIVGLDLYDVGCNTPNTSLTFKELAGEPAGLNHFVAFANAHRKPMSLPEWGLSTIPSGDDPGYIDGMGQTVAKGDFAFQAYFEGGGANVKALPLGPGTPLSDAAYRQWFG
jgi:hypothetical protein